MFIIYITDFSTKNKTGVHFFTKIKFTEGWKYKKTIFFSYFISEIPNFSHMGFFRKCSKFRRSIPLMPQRNVTSKNPPTQKCQIDVSRGKLGMDASPKGHFQYIWGYQEVTTPAVFTFPEEILERNTSLFWVLTAPKEMK